MASEVERNGRPETRVVVREIDSSLHMERGTLGSFKAPTDLERVSPWEAAVRQRFKI